MSTSSESSTKSLSMILEEQPYLCDLHTHLLGMGNAGFWIDTILMDEFIMPTNQTFKGKPYILGAPYPLVWHETKNSGFVDCKAVAEFFHHLVNNNIFRKEIGQEKSSFEDTVSKTSQPIDYEAAMTPLRTEFPILHKLISTKLYNDLIHGGLEFEHDFSYDVVLTLADLRKGLGIEKSDCEGFVQLAITEKLGGHLPNRSIKFQHWIIFNARKQEFEIVYGMQVEQLRELIRINPNAPSQAAKLARAHLVNAFSMCDAEGNHPRPIDFHSFHGFFTPEFYPRRFALKDSIYSQRLDVLAALIVHVMKRYRTCSPPVKYCELSISANDLSKRWVFDVLRSVRIYNEEVTSNVQDDLGTRLYVATEQFSSFSQLVLHGYFSYLQAAFKGPKNTPGLFNVTYKFLAGFDRQKIKAPFPTDQDKGIHLLYCAPHEAILLMTEEIKKTQEDQRSDEDVMKELEEAYKGMKENDEKAFDPYLKQLRLLAEIAKNVTWFSTWVVGLDLFGDELGYPYCPFVARPFIAFVWEQRKKNPYFGMRIHGGENVKYADDQNPAYRLFIAHMYIVFRSLLFLQQELKYGIRIGHGIAFSRILNADLSSPRHRKSSVLLAEMRHLANSLFKKVAFEVNLTSNEYLLGQTLRQADFARILQLDELFKMGAPIMLATDDDGIWPIDQCPVTHPGHQSLAAEYCRAISTSLIDSSENLLWTFDTMKKFCFSDIGDGTQRLLIQKRSREFLQMNNVIVHPHIVRLIFQDYEFKPEDNSTFNKYRISQEISKEFQPELDWRHGYGAKRVAFVCICSQENLPDKKTLCTEYNRLFGPSKTPLKEFDFIYDSWKRIYEDFVECKTDRCLEITIEHQAGDEREYHSIWSTEPSSKHFNEFLKNFQWSGKEINIRAYANEANVDETLSNFEASHPSSTDNNAGNGTLFLFTNTEKYTYAYSKVEEKFRLRLNPHASKRETTEENFIYVSCHRARAATAALNLISELISKLVDAPATSLLCINNPMSFGTTVGPTESIPNPAPASFTVGLPTNQINLNQKAFKYNILKRSLSD